MIEVKLEYDTDTPPVINEDWLAKACAGILEEQGHEEASLTLIFSNEEALRRLKKEYFSKDQFTDVIAFNLEEANEPLEGEIYISIERVRENAREFSQEFDTELKRVIIHGCLHITGLDDQVPEEKQNMTQLEDSYLAKFSEPVLA